MKAKRLWWTFRTVLTRGSGARADYARKKNIYRSMGENVSIQPRTIPLYPELISFGNNVVIAKNVDFCTHDVIHVVLNNLNSLGSGGVNESCRFRERIGCIEICDNVFVGSNSVILYDVRIGPNVIIASGSVIVKDCEPDGVYAGVPARKVGTFSDFIRKRTQMENDGMLSTTSHNQSLTSEEIREAWLRFGQNHRDERMK